MRGARGKTRQRNAVEWRHAPQLGALLHLLRLRIGQLAGGLQRGGKFFAAHSEKLLAVLQLGGQLSARILALAPGALHFVELRGALFAGELQGGDALAGLHRVHAACEMATLYPRRRSCPPRRG